MIPSRVRMWQGFVTAVACALGIALTATSPAHSVQGPTNTLHINEVLHNPEGTDTPFEYLEIKGSPNATIPSCTYVVFIESNSTSNGDVQEIFDLSNRVLGSNGFLIFLQAGNSYPAVPATTTIVGTTTGFGGIAGYSSDNPTGIENEAYTVLLVRSVDGGGACVAPTLTTDIDTNNDGVAEFPATWTVLDGVAALEPGLVGAAYATAKCDDGEWVGRPTGDPSGMDQDAWVCAPFDNGDTFPFTLGATTAPAAYAGLDLNHVGSANWPAPDPVIPEAGLPVALSLSALAAGAFAVHRSRRTATA